MGIEKEVVQPKFRDPLQKAMINILYTGNWFHARDSKLLKPFGITTQQYNILRILRGQLPKPASISLLTERMLDKMSNASRLVDKLLAKGLVERNVSPHDRRQADVIINEKGLEMLSRIDPLTDLRAAPFSKNLTEEELTLLSDLLDRLRG